ncbi:MAG: S26 family signal peptidase [Angustibacter sp.]
MSVTGLAALGAGVAALRRRWTVVCVVGGSMLPALREGDVLLARRRRPHGARVGDIVVFEPPSTDGRPSGPPAHGPGGRRTWMVKRVAALPGEPVPDGVAGSGLVPARSLVVLGDNGGLDSRLFGFLPDEHVLAVVLRPLTRARLPGPDYVVHDDVRLDPLLDQRAERQHEDS